MRRYEAYKDSGVEWIGEIPVGWEIRRLKTLATNDIRKTPTNQGAYIGLESIQPWTQRFLESAEDSNDPEGNYYDDDCVLFGKLRPYLAKVFVPTESGQCSSEFLILRSELLSRRYLSYSLINGRFIDEVNSLTYGAKMPRASWETIGSIPSPLPSAREQAAIADYLDAKTARIDSIVSQTERSIGLLREYRKSVISEAVTKGLNPDAPMKDSGVEWIGEIPGEWSLVKLGIVSTKIGSGKTPRGGADVYHEEGIPFLRSQNIYDTGLRLDDVAYISEEVDEEMSATRVFEGDVLLNITGGSIGRCCTYDLEAHANVNQHVCIIRPSGKALPKWIRYFWNSNPGRTTVDIHQSGANREGLNFEQIAAARIPLPSVGEQKEIVSYIDAKTAEIDSLIADKQRQVELLKEYRKSLISEAVTGKFKVPGLE
ncbi:MAG: restriction endonuclease subunit S [Eggerthellaceae bacterium]